MKYKTVVALGDSITYGYPYTPHQSWVEAMRQATGWQVINSGNSGDTLQDMAERLERDVLKFKPQIIIVMGGTNDVYQGLSQPQLQTAFLKIMKGLQEAGSEIWIGLPLPVADGTEGSLQLWRSWLTSYARAESLTLIDFYQDFITNQGQIREDLLLDGCHPSLKGYELMGKRIIIELSRGRGC